VPPFVSRQVLVKAWLGFNMVPSGMLMSSTLLTRLQFEVAVAGMAVGGTLVGGGSVGAGTVFVGEAAGLVAEAIDAACVSWTCTVCAAAVDNALMSSVGCAPEGRLQADARTRRSENAGKTDGFHDSLLECVRSFRKALAPFTGGNGQMASMRSPTPVGGDIIYWFDPGVFPSFPSSPHVAASRPFASRNLCLHR
jgi:hypothetical protein